MTDPPPSLRAASDARSDLAHGSSPPDPLPGDLQPLGHDLVQVQRKLVGVPQLQDHRPVVDLHIHSVIDPLLLTAAAVPIVANAIRAALGDRTTDDLVGVTCLARGADQVFARVVLDLGGTIEVVLSTVDALVAVWDGGPSGGHGGTADVVVAARERGLPVTVVWPDGAERD